MSLSPLHRLRPDAAALAVVALVLSAVFNGFVPRLMSLRGDRLEPVLAFSHEPKSLIGADFADVYVAANKLLAGLDPYQDYPELGSRYNDPFPWRDRPRFNYGLLSLLLVFPFASFDYLTAYRLWTAMQLVLFAAAVALQAGLLRRWSTRVLFAVTALQLFSFSPDFWLYLERGQHDLALVLLVTLSLLLLIKFRHSLSAVLVAAASLLKPYPLLLLIIFPLKRQWRATVWAGAALAAGLAISLAWVPQALSVTLEAGRDGEVLTQGDASLTLNSAVRAAFAPAQPLMKLLVAVDDRTRVDLLLLPGEDTGLFGGYQVDALAFYGSAAAFFALAAVLGLHALRFSRAELMPRVALAGDIYLYAFGAGIFLLAVPVTYTYKLIWATFFLLLSFALADFGRLPWLHFALLAVTPPLLLVYLPLGWGRTLIGVPLIALLVLIQFWNRRITGRRVLWAGLLLAVLIALPVGKAWLLALLVLYYAVNAPGLIAPWPPAGGRGARIEIA